MTILMKFPVDDAYDAAISDDDIVLSRIGPTLESRAAELLDFHDGAVEPERIVSLAEDWNKCIEKRLDAVLARMQAAAGPRHDGTRAWLDCPPSDIYALKKAAMALDGDFYDFADSALLMKDRNHLSVLLKDVELSDVMARPEDYAVIEVTPK